LNPDINRDPYSVQEDLKLLELRQKIGNRWSEIVKLLPGRTENSVKNRFNCMFKKIREEKLEQNRNQSIQDALKKIEGVGAEILLDEDNLIKELIKRKKEEA